MPFLNAEMLELIISSGPILLLMAILLEHKYPIAKNWHPLTFFSLLSHYLASKVNKGSDKQKKLSGSLLSILVLSCSYLIVYLLDFINLYPALFHFALLYCCLKGGLLWKNWQQMIEQLSIAKTAINQSKVIPESLFTKQNALEHYKQLLKPFVLRKLDSLSAYGLQKASLESLPQQITVHWFGVIFYFVFFEIHITVLYVLIINLAQTFNQKQSQYQHFAWFSSLLYKLFAFAPLLLISLTLMLYGPMRSALVAGQQSAKKWHYWASGFLLGVLSSNIANSFGGPRIYHSPQGEKSSCGDKKVRLPNIISPDDHQNIQVETLQLGRERLRYSAQLWLIILVFHSVFTLYFRLQ